MTEEMEEMGGDGGGKVVEATSYAAAQHKRKGKSPMQEQPKERRFHRDRGVDISPFEPRSSVHQQIPAVSTAVSTSAITLMTMASFDPRFSSIPESMSSTKPTIPITTIATSPAPTTMTMQPSDFSFMRFGRP